VLANHLVGVHLQALRVIQAAATLQAELELVAVLLAAMPTLQPPLAALAALAAL
jgi:hypothetical protein